MWIIPSRTTCFASDFVSDCFSVEGLNGKKCHLELFDYTVVIDVVLDVCGLCL